VLVVYLLCFVLFCFAAGGGVSALSSTGAAALYLERFPAAGAAEVKTALMRSATFGQG
jgi:hypothetical protein